MNNIERVMSYQDEMIKNLQELIRIPSIEGAAEENMPFGKDVNDALEYTLDLCKRLGMNVTNVDGYAGHADFGPEDAKESIGVILHLDVVPAPGEWNYPPFSGTLADGKIHGRGATDDKGPAIASIYAVKALMDEGYLPNKKIRLIFGTNEETRWEDMKYYLEKYEEPTFSMLPDAYFPLVYAEKGILDFTFNKVINEDCLQVSKWEGGIAFNVVADQAEIVLSGQEAILTEIEKEYRKHTDEHGFVSSFEKTRKK